MDKTIRTLLSDAPGQVFLMSAEERLTREDCADLITQRVHELRSNGLSPGDIVAIELATSLDAVIWILSIMEAGLTVLPVNTREPASRIEQQLARLEVGLVLGPKSLLHPGGESYEPATGVGRLLIRTSGTTANGKLVQLDWSSLLHGAGCAARHLQFGPGDRWLLNLPLYHVGGLGPIWRSLVGGGAMVLPDSGEDFSHVSLVSTQLQRVVTGKDPTAFKKCRKILLGGGPVSETLLQEAQNLGLSVVTSYGLTETGSLIAVDGLPTGSCDIKLASDGEILVRGPGLFAGYFDPATGESSLPTTADGWFRTGDLGHFDDRQRLCVSGRKDNQFISGGENIQPEEIEAALLSLADVRQAIVVGIPDAEFGMRPVAFVEADRDDLAAQLESKFPKYKIPTKFIDLPDNPHGIMKPSRAELSRLALKLQ